MTKPVLIRTASGQYWQGAFLSTLDRLSERLGSEGVIPFRLGVTRCLLVYDPDLILEAGRLEADGKLERLRFVKDFKQFVGDSLFTSQGEEWTQRRRTVMFHLKNAPNRQAWETSGAAAASQTIRAKAWIGALPLAQSIIFHAPIDAMFGPVGLDPQRLNFCTRQISTATELVASARLIFGDWNKWMAFPALLWGKFWARRLNLEIDSVHPAPDSPAADPRMRSELVTLLFASQDTFTMFLASTLWLLALHPEFQETLRAEIEVHGTDSPLLEAALLETLRLIPSAHSIARDCVVPFELGGRRIEPGTLVFLGFWPAHRRWPQPDRFHPHRFLQTPASKRHVVAFGVGPKRCAGEHMAKAIVAGAIAQILASHQISTDLREVETEAGISVRFRRSPRLNFHPLGASP